MRGKGARKRIRDIVSAFERGNNQKNIEEQSQKRARSDRTAGASKRQAGGELESGSSVTSRTEPEVEHVDLSSGDIGDVTGDNCNQIIDFQSLLNKTSIDQSNNVDRSNVVTGCGEQCRNMTISSNLGQIQINDVSLGIEPIWCAGDDISVHVPKPIKAQICRGEYVNIALLLKGAMELNDICKGNTLSLTASGKIETRPRECRDKVNSIEKWTDAFLIFMSIYIKEHPNKVGEMIQYMSLIREAAQRQGGYSWRLYDEQFRIRQAVSPGSWGSLNQDLWLRCMSIKDQASVQPQMVQQKSNTCNDYNQGHCYWFNCKYQHKCSNCGQLHPKVNCFSIEYNAQRAELTQTPSKFINNNDRANNFNYRFRSSRGRMPFRGRRGARGGYY